MAQSPSTFGYVLTWVRNKLQQVEIEMTSQHADSRISNAREGLDNLINNKDSVEKVKTSKQEYQELVEEIQRSEVGVTDAAKKIGDKFYKRING